MRTRLGLTVALFLALVVVTPGAWADEESQVEHVRGLLEEAWGPEEPETLERYLEVRQALKPIFDDKKKRRALEQWALREVSTQGGLVHSIFTTLQARNELEAALSAQSLDFPTYQRLTILVYGRWLRAVREEPAPEIRICVMLQELEIGLARQLANNPPEEGRELNDLTERLAAVRHQLAFTKPFALRDKAQVLEAIDADTRVWLEQHREAIEECDFGVFDTAAPARERAPQTEE